MKLSVIIPCLNGADTVAVQLEALAQQQWSEPWEVVFVDNGSTDNTLAIVRSYQERMSYLRIIDASARRGTPYALNIGVRAARGEAFVIVDADDEVAPGWVAAIGDALAEYEFVASRFDVEKLNSGWVLESRGHPQKDGLMDYTPPFLPSAGCCGLGARRALHDAIGGFDESMPVVFEADYCFRAQLAGFSLHFIPEALVHIRHRSSLRGIYRQARRWAEYNVLLYKRYRPLGMPALSWRDNLRPWVRLLRLLPQVRTQGGRARVIRQIGWRVGRVVGSVKYRVVAL
jgi:glycosyltransferase involved in cell wall biosynthesis